MPGTLIHCIISSGISVLRGRLNEAFSTLKNSEYHSTRICNTCSRKILKVHELVTQLKSSVNTLHEKFQHHYQPKDVDASGKRKLLTPDRGASPFNRKANRVCSQRGSPGSISRIES